MTAFGFTYDSGSTRKNEVVVLDMKDAANNCKVSRRECNSRLHALAHLADEKMIDIEHLAQLLHGQICCHTAILERHCARAFITLGPITILYNKPIRFEHPW